MGDRQARTVARAGWIAAGAAMLASLLPGTGAAQGNSGPALYCEALQLAENYDEELAEFGLLTVGREGVLFDSERSLDALELYPPAVFHDIRRLAEALRHRGTNLVMALTPPRGVVLQEYLDPDNAIQAAFDPLTAAANYRLNLDTLRDAGVIAPNLLQAMMADPVARRESYLFDDFHWAPVGALASARAIADAIRGHPDYARLTPQEFTVESRGRLPVFSLYSAAVDQICGVRPPPRPYEFFATAEADRPPASSEDLLVDAPAASEQLLTDQPAGEGSEALLSGITEENIVLVGTSFSRRQDYDANFANLLAAAAGVFVDNRAEAGGALTVTMDAYLRSRDFQAHPPIFLVWELAAYYSLESEDEFFRAIIPAAFGECEPAEALAAAEAELEGGQVTLIADTEGIPAERSFLFMEVDDLSLVRFTLEIEDASGFVDRVPVERSTRVMNDGRFFLELLDLGAPVVEVRLVYQGDQRGRVASRICREPADVAPLF